MAVRRLGSNIDSRHLSHAATVPMHAATLRQLRMARRFLASRLVEVVPRLNTEMRKCQQSMFDPIASARERGVADVGDPPAVDRVWNGHHTRGAGVFRDRDRAVRIDRGGELPLHGGGQGQGQGQEQDHQRQLRSPRKCLRVGAQPGARVSAVGGNGRPRIGVIKRAGQDGR